MRVLLFMASAAVLFAQPQIKELQPRGTQKGRPFTLTVAGSGLGDGAKIWSTMPATFTALSPVKSGPMGEGRYATFFVEPAGELRVGVYPIRVETPEGISNIQLFTVGAFPEYAEDEARPGALPHSNDTIETAQALPNGPLTINGALQGPERDVYRIEAKRGDRRVIEVEARRCGSAIDPEIEVLDPSGKILARSEDAPMLELDARAEVTFPKDGYYYIVVHDARYSTQAANFYRLKVGSYAYASELFPLGGRRGDMVSVSTGAQTLSADLRNLEPRAKLTFVQPPDSPALPLPFAVGDDPEVLEPVSDAVQAPVTINGRISKAGEVDRYQVRVNPGEWLTLRVQAAELGTSKLMAVLTVFDDKGKKLMRSGDEPLAEDVYNVNQSRTAGDPALRIQAPPGVTRLTVTIEDLALRGGPHYAYRLNVQKMAADFRVVLNTPYVNVPAGGSVAVPVTVQRQGYEGEIELRVSNLPEGLRVEGGFVVAGAPVKETPQNRNSRGVLVLTAKPGLVLAPVELAVTGVAKLPDGSELVRLADGPGMLVNIAGATLQGSVDRQKPFTAPWLGLNLPVAVTKPAQATLEIKALERERLQEGDRLKFRWKWVPVDREMILPKTVTSEMVGAGDVRMIDLQVDPADRTSGTFVITTTKLTRPSKYDLYITGKLKVDGQDQDVVSRPISVQVEEVKPSNDAQATLNR